jgi:hypothetical protein
MMKRFVSKVMRHIMAPRSPSLKDILTKERPFCPVLWFACNRPNGANHKN